MEKRDPLTKALAILGTALVALPVLAPFLFAALGLAAEGALRFDYLMPAELFPAALAGGGLLLWAAIRAQARRGLIGGGLGLAALCLVGSQALAGATGLASGETEPGGWAWALVLGILGVYSLALVVLGVGGAFLLRDLFGAARPRAGNV